jgi:hypothetical protein
VRAAPLIVATGRRIAAEDRRLGFGALVDARRAARSRPLPRALDDPRRLAESVEALLPFVPPRAYGICLRRALLLLELWSRAGLEPTLHLGFRRDAPTRDGHAWLTAIAPEGETLQVSGPNGTEPLFQL